MDRQSIDLDEKHVYADTERLLAESDEHIPFRVKRKSWPTIILVLNCMLAVGNLAALVFFTRSMYRSSDGAALLPSYGEFACRHLL